MGDTPKWMVYNGKSENPIKIDDLGVTHMSRIRSVKMSLLMAYRLPSSFG